MKAYEFKITLIGAKPPVWRGFALPADITFKRLHDTIQMVMGWHDCHMFEFEFKKSSLQIVCDQETLEELQMYGNAETIKTAGCKIDRFVEAEKKFLYTYDTGDYWQHELRLVKILKDYPYEYPQVLDFSGNCPPEDCGGIDGYYDFLEAVGDPANPEHESMLEWGESQDYREYDMAGVNDMMKELLKLKRKKAGLDLN